MMLNVSKYKTMIFHMEYIILGMSQDSLIRISTG